MKHVLKQIAKELKTHQLDYLFLFAAGVSCVTAIKAASGNKLMSFTIMLLFVMFYIFWGVYHHYKLRNLHLKNVVEYILIAFTLLYLLQMILTV